MANEIPRYKLLLRNVSSFAMGPVKLDEDIIEGKFLNRHESSINFAEMDLADKVEHFCQLNVCFGALFLRMKQRFEDCQTIHCCYMEVYHRLSENPNTNIRRLRHYVIDHLTILIHSLMQVAFFMNGEIIRSENAFETLPHHIHPTFFTSFRRLNESGGNTRVQRSLTSGAWLAKLRVALLGGSRDALAPASMERNVKKFDVSVAAHKEHSLNYLAALMDMLVVLQLAVNTKLIRGFVETEDGFDFSLEFIRNDDRKGLQISSITVATRLNLDFNLINFNIAHTVIKDAIDCAVGADVLNDVHYRLLVTSLVDQKRLQFQEHAINLYMTIGIKRANEYYAKIKAAEAGYYTEERHLMWW
jgi:hypothetical protein